MAGLGPAGFHIIRSTATALDDMTLDAYRAAIAERYPRDLMKLRVEEGTVHRRPGVEAAFRYLNHQAPKREEWDWTGLAPGNPRIARIFKRYLGREKK